MRIISVTRTNRATPMQNWENSLINQDPFENFNKYFVLQRNDLTGQYHFVGTDVGWWDAVSATPGSNGDLLLSLQIAIAEVEQGLSEIIFKSHPSALASPTRIFVTAIDSTTGDLVFSQSIACGTFGVFAQEVRALLPIPLAPGSFDTLIIDIDEISAENEILRIASIDLEELVPHEATTFVVVETSSDLRIEPYYKNAAEFPLYLENTTGLVTRPLNSNKTLFLDATEDSEIRAFLGSATQAYLGIESTCEGLAYLDIERNLFLGVQTTSLVNNSFSSTLRVFPLFLNYQTENLNPHSYSKRHERTILGRVDVVWVNPLASDRIEPQLENTAHNAMPDQLFDAITAADYNTFMLHDNDLTGAYQVPGPESQIGWWSNTQFADSQGDFSPALYMLFEFTLRPITDFEIICDQFHGVFPIDLDVVFTVQGATGTTTSTFPVRNNFRFNIPIDLDLSDVISMEIYVYKINLPGMTPVFTEISVGSMTTYEQHDLISISTNEELSLTEETVALGGLSANMCTIFFNNKDRRFVFSNANSSIATNLRKNRKIIPWLGYKGIRDDEIDWFCLGTFWSYNWDIPQDGIYAKVVALDTLGLLNATVFEDHPVFINQTLYDIVDYILSDAKKGIWSLQYRIHESLQDIIAPYVWFSRESHTSALDKLTRAWQLSIYCDRDGVLNVVEPESTTFFQDTWARNTNVMETSFPTQFTAVPNFTEIKTTKVSIETNASLLSMTQPQEVWEEQLLTLLFSAPCVDLSTLQVSVSSTANYSLQQFSWGISLLFSGEGVLNSVVATGAALRTAESVSVTDKNNKAISQDGFVIKSIESPFIQSIAHARELLSLLSRVYQAQPYNAEVKYRGDATLTVADPIILKDGLAPNIYYTIRKHELFWNGGLEGAASLFTMPLLVGEIFVTSDDTAYNARTDQLFNQADVPSYDSFTLFDNDLTGTFKALGEQSEVGWWSWRLSDGNGDFATPLRLLFSSARRVIASFGVRGDPLRNVIMVDFDYVLTIKNRATPIVLSVTGNTQLNISMLLNATNLLSIELVVHKINKPFSSPVIIEALFT